MHQNLGEHEHFAFLHSVVLLDTETDETPSTMGIQSKVGALVYRLPWFLKNAKPPGVAGPALPCCEPSTLGTAEVISLLPLLWHLDVWLALSNPSHWLIRMIQLHDSIHQASTEVQQGSFHLSKRGRFCCPSGGDCSSFSKGLDRPCPSSQDEERVPQLLLHHTQERQ